MKIPCNATLLGLFLAALIWIVNHQSVFAQEFLGYPCKSDCTGHSAGFRWAQNRIKDNNDLDFHICLSAKSQSFVEGCFAYFDKNFPRKSVKSLSSFVQISVDTYNTKGMQGLETQSRNCWKNAEFSRHNNIQLVKYCYQTDYVSFKLTKILNFPTDEYFKSEFRLKRMLRSFRSRGYSDHAVTALIALWSSEINSAFDS